MPGAVICHRTQALLVDRLAGWAIDFLLHLLRQGLRVETACALEEGHLSPHARIRVSQTAIAQRTRQTIAFGTPELDRLVTSQVFVCPITVQ